MVLGLFYARNLLEICQNRARNLLYFNINNVVNYLNISAFTIQDARMLEILLENVFLIIASKIRIRYLHLALHILSPVKVTSSALVLDNPDE